MSRNVIELTRTESPLLVKNVLNNGDASGLCKLIEKEISNKIHCAFAISGDRK